MNLLGFIETSLRTDNAVEVLFILDAADRLLHKLFALNKLFTIFGSVKQSYGKFKYLIIRYIYNHE